jgi:hypothetical protein
MPVRKELLTGIPSTSAMATDLGHPYWIYIIPIHAPVAATTVFSTPDDGRRKHLKHVE